MKRFVTCLLIVTGLLSFLAPKAWAINPDDLLDAREAFVVTPRWHDAQQIALQLKVAEGYYVYKDKFAFGSQQSGTQLGTANYPVALRKDDPIFGNVEIFRDEFDILLPVLAYSPNQPIQLQVDLQGCADLGVCYPPLSLNFDLPAPQKAVTQKLATIDAFLDKQVTQSDDVLPIDQAFPVAPLPFDGEHLPIEWQVAPGYYLYKDKFSFKLLNGEGLSLGVPQIPKGEIKEDAYFGTVETFPETVVVKLPIQGLKYATELTLQVGYQGCAEVGICYPPMQKVFEVNLTPLSKGAINQSPTSTINTPASEQDGKSFLSVLESPTEVLSNSSLLIAVLIFFAAGLLVSFTPCIFPMVPIVSGIVLGQSSKPSRWRGFLLSLSYVLGMALVFGLAGVLAAMGGGTSIQSALQTPWLVFSFAALFIVLSLSMFGFFEIRLPSSLQEKLIQASDKQKSGSYVGAFIIGALSSLILSPCVTPVLVQTILHIAQKGDYVYGGLALFFMGLGMGVPLLVIGASADKFLPKQGAWMVSIRNLAGCLMLGAAIWTASPFLSLSAIQLSSGVVLLLTTALLWPKVALVDADTKQRLWHGIVLAIAAYGIVLMMQSIQTTPVQRSQTLPESSQRSLDLFNTVSTRSDFDSHILKARNSNKIALLDFYADWCVSCHQLEQETLSDSRVQDKIQQDFYPIRVDVTDNSPEMRKLMQEFQVVGPPIIAFVSAKGEKLPERAIGFIDAEEMLRLLGDAQSSRLSF